MPAAQPRGLRAAGGSGLSTRRETMSAGVEAGGGTRAAGFDPAKPNTARVYDALLGGKDNYAADRELAGQIVALNPGLPGMVRDNRAFIIKAVTSAASD